jgi:RHS repeat-associated protein
MTHDGTNSLTYDANGNMTSDGVNSYVWDRANRLLSMGGVSYAYNGDGNRIQQDALKYILDLQPGLTQVIGDSNGNRYVHSPRGIHAVSDGAAWTYPLTDALGSVRGYIGANNAVLSNVIYTPIGVPDVNIIGPAFTGEWRTGGTGIQYHSARHLSPGLGVWLSMDPFEGMVGRPMSLNRYSWVEGNSPNLVDQSGNYGEHPNQYASCVIPPEPSVFSNCYGTIKSSVAGRSAAIRMGPGERFDQVGEVASNDRYRIAGLTSAHADRDDQIDDDYKYRWFLLSPDTRDDLAPLGWIPGYLVVLNDECIRNFSSSRFAAGRW